MFQDSVASVVDQSLVAAVGLFVTVFVGWTIGSHGLGLYSVTVVIILAIHSVQASLILQGMSVFGPRLEAGEQERYRTFLVVVSLACVVGLSLIGAIVTIGYYQTNAISSVAALAITGSLLYANCFCAQNLIRRDFYVRKQPQRALRMSVIFLLAVMAGLVILHLLGEVTLPRIYLMLSVASVMTCLSNVGLFGSALATLDGASLWRFSAEHWKIGRWMILSSPLIIGAYPAYYFLVSSQLSFEDAGLLKAADTLVVPFEQLGVALSLLFLPQLSRYIDGFSVREQWKWLRRILLTTGSASLIYVAALLYFGQGLVKMIFGGAMGSSGDLIPIMAAIPALKAVAYPSSIGLHALRRQDLVFASYALSSGTTLTLGYWCIEKYGLRGAAYGLVGSVGMFALASWVLLIVTWTKEKKSSLIQEGILVGQKPAAE